MLIAVFLVIKIEVEKVYEEITFGFNFFFLPFEFSTVFTFSEKRVFTFEKTVIQQKNDQNFSENVSFCP